MSRRYTLTFESFRIVFPQRTLSCDGREIKLGSRALEILVALAEAAGELVSNQALVARVWPNTIVDEGSLRVHMSALRKALEEGGCGGRLIVNEMGRGYRLAAVCNICGQLDSMPLAVEKAIADIASMDATALSTRLVEAVRDDASGVDAEQSLRRALAVAIRQGVIAWADMIEDTLAPSTMGAPEAK